MLKEAKLSYRKILEPLGLWPWFKLTDARGNQSTVATRALRMAAFWQITSSAQKKASYQGVGNSPSDRNVSALEVLPDVLV